MSELQLHRAAIAPQLMLAEFGRVFFELILCIVIIVLASAKCFPKPNEPNDPDDDWHMLKTPLFEKCARAAKGCGTNCREINSSSSAKTTAQMSRNRVPAGTNTV